MIANGAQGWDFAPMIALARFLLSVTALAISGEAEARLLTGNPAPDGPSGVGIQLFGGRLAIIDDKRLCRSRHHTGAIVVHFKVGRRHGRDLFGLAFVELDAKKFSVARADYLHQGRPFRQCEDSRGQGEGHHKPVPCVLLT